MARETKVEREAREETLRNEFYAKFVAVYPDRLLNLVYEYGTLGCDFRVERDGESFYFLTDGSSYLLPAKIEYYSPNLDNTLGSAEYEVDSYRREEAERRRLNNVRAEARRKVAELLNDEERKLLGL